VRRWLTYLTMFVAASILIGDVISLVYTVLGGELTVRFVLKVLTVGAIAGSVFGYYMWDLRGDEEAPRARLPAASLPPLSWASSARPRLSPACDDRVAGRRASAAARRAPGH
jgi:hypothetical protein